jgi:hypothetical protein
MRLSAGNPAWQCYVSNRMSGGEKVMQPSPLGSDQDRPRGHVPRAEAPLGDGVNLEEHELDRVWQVFAHDDDLLAQRVAFFLVAESILLATAASLVNAVSGMTSRAHGVLRAEIFSFALIIVLAGMGLSVVFWYVFRLNFDNIGASLDLLKNSQSIYGLIKRRQHERRRGRKYISAIFHKRGVNWATVNCLGFGFVTIWAFTGIFAILVFASHRG